MRPAKGNSPDEETLSCMDANAAAKAENGEGGSATTRNPDGLGHK